MLEYEVVSTAMAAASPPSSWISRATVVMVESWELGSGGKGLRLTSAERGVIDFAATITVMVG